MRQNLLVVGYGNTLRQDDGAGPCVAQRIEAMNLPGVATLACPQLSPEYVPAISEARVVVFVDAALDATADVQFVRVAASSAAHIMAHALNPSTVLALARDVYGREPEGWMLTIPAKQLEFGENFSLETQQAIERAIDELLRKFGLARC